MTDRTEVTAADIEKLRAYLDTDEAAQGESWSRDVIRQVLAERDGYKGRIEHALRALDSFSWHKYDEGFVRTTRDALIGGSLRAFIQGSGR